MKQIMTFNINGQKYVEAVEPGTTLLDFLREQLHLTGAKKGCNDCHYSRFLSSYPRQWTAVRVEHLRISRSPDSRLSQIRQPSQITPMAGNIPRLTQTLTVAAPSVICTRFPILPNFVSGH